MTLSSVVALTNISISGEVKRKVEPLSVCDVGYQRDILVGREFTLKSQFSYLPGKGGYFFDKECETFFLGFDIGKASESRATYFEKELIESGAIEYRLFEITARGRLLDDRSSLSPGVIPPFGIFEVLDVLEYSPIREADVEREKSQDTSR